MAETTQSNRTNGRPSWKWLVGILGAAVITGVSSWASYMMGYDARLDERIIRVAQRTTVVESRLAGIESSLLAMQTEFNLVHQELAIIRSDLREQWKRK